MINLAGDKNVELFLRTNVPHTYNAFQNFVMAMADFVKNRGKKSFFGRDKGQESYENFLIQLKKSIHCLLLDGQIKESDSSQNIISVLGNVMLDFAKAHPNWKDAFGFFAYFFLSDENEANALAVIDRARSP